MFTEREFIAEKREELKRSHNELLTVNADESEFIDEDVSELPEFGKRKILKENAEMVTLEFEL